LADIADREYGDEHFLPEKATKRPLIPAVRQKNKLFKHKQGSIDKLSPNEHNNKETLVPANRNTNENTDDDSEWEKKLEDYYKKLHGG
jgi:hypothetical protein